MMNKEGESMVFDCCMSEEVLKQIKILEEQYEYNWGKKVDYIILPKGMTQEILALTLERIVETGESLLVGYNKIKEQIRENEHAFKTGVKDTFFKETRG